MAGCLTDAPLNWLNTKVATELFILFLAFSPSALDNEFFQFPRGKM
jgi:hypothetical protein